MRKKHFLCAYLLLVFLPTLLLAQGTDCWKTSCSGDTRWKFQSEPIPPDFFDPGSEPFQGEIILGGQPGFIDTQVQRLGPLIFDDGNLPDTQQIPIQIIQLDLVSCSPITVVTNGEDVLWDVQVSLSGDPVPPGQLTATKEHLNGGTFNADFFVKPVFIFTQVGNPGEIRIYGDDEPLAPKQFITTQDMPWTTSPPITNPGGCGGPDFFPGIEVLNIQQSGDNSRLGQRAAGSSSPYFAIDSLNQWDAALADGRVQPIDQFQWDDYMLQWDTHLQEGLPYPANQFLPASIYGWECEDGDCQRSAACSSEFPIGACSQLWPEDNCAAAVFQDPNLQCYCDLITGDGGWNLAPGLVMSLGSGSEPPGDYASAWVFTYPEDPDLSNATISIKVFPPCGVNAVSLGMRDMNGNIRAWYWTVVSGTPGPGQLACGISTTINVNTSLTGTGASIPVAASYTSNPAFNITQVIDIIVDENFQWVGQQPVPAPGTTLSNMWNYWYDLIVTPNVGGIPTNGFLKWTQPPVQCEEQQYLGWDEVSILDYQPLLADDWLCLDERPITDIHWWGSFLDWFEPVPPQLPIGFQFSIWSDTPKNPNNFRSFSHPNVLLWQHTCYNYNVEFVGFDRDPRPQTPSTDPTFDPTIDDAFQLDHVTWWPMIHDACFKFECDIPEEEWFYQEPNTPWGGRVHWLSISAIYPPGEDPIHPWGWKTRPHNYNDDAVRIMNVQSGQWPPQIGDQFQAGVPIEFPQWVSWDLSFDLTTNQDCDGTLGEPNPDLDSSGFVNIVDFAIFVEFWLQPFP